MQFNTANRMLTNEAVLTICFEVPDLFPIPVRMIESKGSHAVQSGITRDMEKLVSAVIDRFAGDAAAS